MEIIERQIVGAQGFFVGRRDVGYESIEEIIDIALNDQVSLDKLNFLHWKERELIESIRERDEKEFTFFYGANSPFSQSYNSRFTSSKQYFHKGINEEQKAYLHSTLPSQLKFSSAEQFVVYHKAIIFMDRDVAKAVMESSDKLEIKAFGKQVKNYDDVVWKYHRSNIVYEANFLKFNQNSELLNDLANTVGTTLAEASNDEIWGIGLLADNSHAQNRKTWAGKNLLGEILTTLRMEIMGFY